METTTIRIDRETKVRLEELAADSPLARYLRELSIELTGKPRPVSPIEKRLQAIEDILRQRESPSKDLADLIVETRGLAQKLNYSEKRLKTLDIFLAKASPETVAFINRDLRNKLEHPENFGEDYERAFFDEMLIYFREHLLPWLMREQVEGLLKLLKERENDGKRA